MKYLFIDTNIWLSLYAFTKDDIEQFNKLNELLGKEIKLLIPRQVYDEVIRNRDNKLKDMLKKFDMNVVHFPAFSKAYVQYTDFKAKCDDIQKDFTQWKFEIEKDIEQENLPADKTIKLFMTEDNLLECDSVIVKAHRRFLKGNPPGKSGAFDAINWECLLKYVPDNTDLYVVSADQDYCSSLDDCKINGFLSKEWESEKHAKVYLYRELVTFLKEHAETIQLYNQLCKMKLIEQLSNSGSFTGTHDHIKKLTEFSDWSDDEIYKLCKAAVENNQVRWIINDADIKKFYEDVLKLCPETLLDNTSIVSVREMLENSQDSNGNISELWAF